MKKNQARTLVLASFTAILAGIAVPAMASDPPTQVSFKDATARNAAVNEGVAEISWNVPQVGNPVGYSVTAIPQEPGYSSKPGGRPVCANNVCTSLVVGLTGGVDYSFQVTAFFGGTDQSSASSSVSNVVTAPGAPTQLTAAGSSQTEIQLSWTAPTNNGGSVVTEYRIKNSETGLVVATSSFEDTNQTISGLQSGQRYTFTIEAVNSMGSSPAVPFPTTATGTATPGEPAPPVLEQSGSDIQVSWEEPDPGASSITSYRVYLLNSANTQLRAPITPTPSTNLAVTIPNVVPGTYKVQVQAVNNAGPGARSLASTITVTEVVSGGGGGSGGGANTGAGAGSNTPNPGTSKPVAESKPRTAFIDVISGRTSATSFTVTKSWRQVSLKVGSTIRMEVRSLKPRVAVTTWIRTPNGQTFKISNSRTNSAGRFQTEAFKFKEAGNFKLSIVFGSSKRSLVVSVSK